MSIATPLSEADLHGLVDGHLEPGRRTDVLRRLAVAPADRARVDAWQEQNDILKAAFLGTEKESLPPALRLVPAPALCCIPQAETCLADRASGRPSTPRLRRLAFISVLLVIAGGLAGSWMLVQAGDDIPRLVDLRGSVDASLAAQADVTAEADTKHPGRLQSPRGTGLPTATIPDLSAAGFAFASAETPTDAPRSLVFHYHDILGERVVVSVARAPRIAFGGPTPIGRGFSWHRGENAFAIAGTVGSARLRAMASLLQGTAADE